MTPVSRPAASCRPWICRTCFAGCCPHGPARPQDQLPERPPPAVLPARVRALPGAELPGCGAAAASPSTSRAARSQCSASLPWGRPSRSQNLVGTPPDALVSVIRHWEASVWSTKSRRNRLVPASHKNRPGRCRRPASARNATICRGAAWRPDPVRPGSRVLPARPGFRTARGRSSPREPADPGFSPA